MTWGYAEDYRVEKETLMLLNDVKPPILFSTDWWKLTNSDLIFTSENFSSLCVKTVCIPVLRTQHQLLVYDALKPTVV